MTHCRLCRGGEAAPWLDFGSQPNSVRLLSSPEAPAPCFPLVLSHCPACGFVFIDQAWPPEAFYDEAQQSTSLFPADHLPWLAQTIAAGCASVLVPLFEIGCNDGYFLDLLQARGMTELAGIEPSDPCAAMARAKGLPVETGYFTLAWARARAAEGLRPSLLICRHVMEHVLDLDDFVCGMDLLLASGGRILIELPDLRAIQEMGDLSAIWEQHVNYFDLHSLERLFARFGYRVTEHYRLPHGGGSLLAWLERGDPPTDFPAPDRTPLRSALLATARGLTAFLHQLKAEGRRVVAFGAGMRGTMLINLGDFGDYFECVLDDNPAKVGRWLPGSGLPIRPTHFLTEAVPDVCVVLPLNSKETERRVMARFLPFTEAGGRFAETLLGPGVPIAFAAPATGECK